jgi:Tol biopolymer transport system component
LDSASESPVNIVPFFSPDGAWIAFWGLRDGALRRIPSAGGPPEVITQLPPGTGLTIPWGESWGTDGNIVFSAAIYSGGEGIFRVSANGGVPERITAIDAAASERRHLLPHLLPGNRTLLYTAEIDMAGARETVVVAARLDTGERRVLLERAADARYVPSGHLLFMRSGTLMAAGFDSARLELTTDPVAVLADVAQSIGGYNSDDETYEGQFVVTADGTLLYLTGGLYPLRETQIVAVDRDGTETILHGSAGDAWGPRFAPDGNRIAFVKRTRQMFGHTDIWIYDVERATERRATFDGSSVWPAWSPDGREILITTNPLNAHARRLFRVVPDGNNPVPVGSGGRQGPTAAWSKALDSVAFVTNEGNTRQIWVQPMNVDAAPTLIAQGPYELTDPMFSPDGRWLAYVSEETGQYEIYVQPYSTPGDKVRISTNGGVGPIWSADGRELFYVEPGGAAGLRRMMAVDVDLTAGFRASRPRQLFEGSYAGTLPLRNYDYDGRRFAMMKVLVDGPPNVTHMHVVLNWLDELRRRVPVPP